MAQVVSVTAVGEPMATVVEDEGGVVGVSPKFMVGHRAVTHIITVTVDGVSAEYALTVDSTGNARLQKSE